MTGPEHYAEAERLLRNAQDALNAATPREIDAALEVAGAAAVAAQAHATLALVAATAENDAETGKSERECAAWERVLV